MNTEQMPIMTVTGIRKAAGDFEDQKGKTIEFSNTVVTVLQPYSDREKEQGAIGMKSTDYKIKGAQFFNDYMHQPRAVLHALNFDIPENEHDDAA